MFSFHTTPEEFKNATITGQENHMIIMLLALFSKCPPSFLVRVTAAKLTNLWPSFPDGIGIWGVGFCGGKKTGEPGEKPSEQGQEPTTNSTHMWSRVRESNPGHRGGRRVFSPLLHPCSPLENEKPTFSNSSSLKSIFGKLRFRVVWTVGLTVEIKLHFNFKFLRPALCWRRLHKFLFNFVT